MARRLHQRFSCTDLTSEVLVTRFSPDSNFLATGSADGAVRIYQPRTGALQYTLPSGVGGDAMPVTALRWRLGAASAGKTKNVLIAATADGQIRHWHVSSQKVLTNYKAPDQIYCLDARADGEQFASAGKDKTVRLHDDSTGNIVVTCRPGGFETVGHSNRVFSVKYHPTDSRRIVSGGWDNSVIIWDARTGGSTASIFGPHICGDSVDVHDNVVLTGSWRPDKQLQLWDLRYLRRNEPMADVPWSVVPSGSGASAALATRQASRGSPALLYAAQFSASGAFIAAGGSGSNEAKLFDATGCMRQAAVIPEPATDAAAATSPTVAPAVLSGTIAGLARSVYSVAFDGDDGLAVSGGDFLFVFDIAAAGGAAAGAGTASYAAPSDDSGAAFAGAVATTDASSGRKLVTLSSAEEAAVLAAYGGGEDDGDAVGPDDDADSKNPGARFGAFGL